MQPADARYPDVRSRSDTSRSPPARPALAQRPLPRTTSRSHPLVSRSRRSWEPQAVLPAEPRDALRLEVVPVAGRQAGDVRHPGYADRLRRGHLLTQLVEEVLEAGGRDDLEDAARRVAGVPERVP